jgi:hypothetical protein
MKRKLADVEMRHGFLYIKGEYYEGTHKDGKPCFVRVSKNKTEKLIQMAKDIAKEIRGKLDPEKVLVEAILRFENKNDIEKLHNIVFNAKKKYKAKTRAHHCVDMKVGNFIIPVVD